MENQDSASEQLQSSKAGAMLRFVGHLFISPLEGCCLLQQQACIMSAFDLSPVFAPKNQQRCLKIKEALRRLVKRLD